MKRALLVACALVFCILVWPTPYRYDQVGGRLVKTNRITAAFGLDAQSAADPWPSSADFWWVYVVLGFGLGGIVGYVVARRRLPTRSATPVLVTAAALALVAVAAIVMRYKVAYAPGLAYGVRLDRWTGATELVPVVIEEIGPAPIPKPPPGFVLDTPPPSPRTGAVVPYSDLPPGAVLVSTPTPSRVRKK